MARAIWKGAISFGMVAIPMKLYIATESKDISFVTLHKTCHSRLKQKRWCPFHEEEIESGDVVRGYEFAKDEFMVMEEEDFEDLPLNSKHTIEIVSFVDLAEVDPVHYEKSYYVEPESVGIKPFYLLKKALEQSNRVAIAKVALRQKEHLCLVRSYGDGLIMDTMYYPDEIRTTAELDWPAADTIVTDAELAMANMLIEQLAGEFHPEQFQDEYRDALLQVIEGKLGTGAVVSPAPAAPAGKVRDLMEALRESIEAAKADRAQSPGLAEQAEQVAEPKKRTRKAG
ncbi:MAG: Ku protein [Chloroflexi bacterium]|nr:Ku protein [Chloroflexota bacterium]